ncbi:transmembrane protein 200A-like [Amblyraja radiata]|uniref:transmembrane protein 200A-like n=1 Tax=Amblyraja radiata TaxID=386614 RepID=UPI0014037EA4|nr:transmembrane protein 200A-like [Amblyraja radiata]
MMSTENKPATKTQKSIGQPALHSRGKASRSNYISRDDKSVKAKINMRSPAGLFIILGLLIVMVGIAIAVAGYWPYKHNVQAPVIQRGTNNSELAVNIQLAKSRLHPRPGQRNEKLKLIGPLIMGIGLFVFICANTVLYENRDRETKLLAQGKIYSIAGQAVNGDDSEAERSLQDPIPSSTETSAIEETSSAIYDHERSCANSANHKMTAQLLHHKRPSPSVSLCSVASESGNSSEGNLNVPLNYGSESVSTAVVLPVIKLNNCVIDTPVVADVVEDTELGQSVTMLLSTEELSRLQNHGYIRSGSIRSADDAPRIVDTDQPSPRQSFPNRFIGRLFFSGATRKTYCSDLQLHTSCGHSGARDLGINASELSQQQQQTERQQHRSWPRLDCSYIKKYLKLENREDSVDKLLEQAEREYAGEEQNVKELRNERL